MKKILKLLPAMLLLGINPEPENVSFSDGGMYEKKEEKPSVPRKKRTSQWALAAFWLLSMLYLEVLAHSAMFDSFRSSFRFALGFTAGVGLVLGLLTGFLPGKAAFSVSLVLSVLLAILYGSQIVYCFIFQTPYSVSQMGMGADAVTNFWGETIATIGSHFGWILGLLVPSVVLILLYRLVDFRKQGRVCRGVVLGLAVVLPLTAYLGVRRGGTAAFSDYYFFTSTKSTTAQTMERFGVPMTFYLESVHTGGGAEDPEEGGSALTAVVSQPTEAEETEPEEVPPTWNVLPIDFDALNGITDNEKIQALNNYCAQLTGTKQNEYTGMLKDYNLILICAESFSTAAIDPEITPTLYKLSHEGFVFENFYNSFPNTTIDGEYTLMQGLYPDASRGKESSSMLASAENYLPYAPGNIFASQRNVKSWGYHNNIRSYYMRYLTHPNMGYEMKFNHSGMEMTGYWPTSDLEMMEQSVDDYIGADRFNVYYMTFSGHYMYRIDKNQIAKKNYDQVKDLPLQSQEAKAYLSCHIELDKALEYLLNKLEEAGVADKTVIVLAPDHIPYGLLKSQYFDLMKQEPDDFARYKSTLIFWVGGMEEPVPVDTYCSNVDILPTILNLWGFDYDSRLLPGTDIFSDSPHQAVLIDRSFLTDKVWFNSNTGEIRYQVDESEIPEGYIDAMNQRIAAQFDYSTQVLKTDYFRFVYENQNLTR